MMANKMAAVQGYGCISSVYISFQVVQLIAFLRMPASMLGFLVIYRPHVLTPRSGRQVRESGAQATSRVFRLRLFVCYRTPSLQPKYQTTAVNYTALYDHSLLQPYTAQPTLLACQCRGPRSKSQICSGDREIEPEPIALAAECLTRGQPRPLK